MGNYLYAVYVEKYEEDGAYRKLQIDSVRVFGKCSACGGDGDIIKITAIFNAPIPESRIVEEGPVCANCGILYSEKFLRLMKNE